MDKSNKTEKYLLLSEKVKDMSLSELPSELVKWIKEKEVKIEEYKLKMGYDDCSAEEVFKKVLPENMNVSSFESVGHLIHLNLREEQLPYKYVIGQILLDKNPRMKTVMNKIGSINNIFRTFDMELLAGIDDTVVTVNESNAKFTFDYRKVYWNSRLQSEHHRLIKELCKDKSRIIADMFCGVGPFVIPLAMSGLEVYGNDLNPESVKYLEINAKQNKVIKRVHIYNKDARDFIKELVNVEKIEFSDVIMNLPADSIEFLDCFVDLYPKECKNFPIIHCYSFSTAEDTHKDVLNRVEKTLMCKIGDNLVEIRDVRDVSPGKMMILISFKLPIECCKKDSEEVLKKRKT